MIFGCITKFIPETNEEQNLLVIEGLITDQPEPYTIKLSWSIPVGINSGIRPLKGCKVTVQDDLGNNYLFSESAAAGLYISDKETFRGIIGRKYTMHINTNNATETHYSYESKQVEMKNVPPIDSLFYEKITINEKTPYSGPEEGCQVYLNAFDPLGKCRYYRWDFLETWEFHLPYMVTNQICWISNTSTDINIKNTSVLAEDRITRLPVKYISNETDRLSVRYRIQVNQYSMNEDEYTYWEKMRDISQDVGSLYDITPSSVQGNIFCVEDPGEQVLGFFSVSAKTSERIYIDETFRGQVQLYNKCAADTVFNGEPIPGLNSFVWVIVDNPMPPPPFKVITYDKGCADCTVRGTTTKPIFWED